MSIMTTSMHDHDHHDHEHHEHEHGRSYAEIRALIEASDLSDFVKKHALGIFHRVAVAEAKIHGTAVEAIGFHEVGALDSIADIVWPAWASRNSASKDFRRPARRRPRLDRLRARTVSRSRPRRPWKFSAASRSARSTSRSSSSRRPARPSRRSLPRVRPDAALEDRKNRLRPRHARPAQPPERLARGARRTRRQGYAWTSPADLYATDTVTQIETNIDDLSPEITGAMIDRLLAAGALDAFSLPAQMKKNRPGVLLTVLCDPVGGRTRWRTDFPRNQRVRGAAERKAAAEAGTADRDGANARTAKSRSSSVSTGRGRLLQVAPEFESCRAAANAPGSRCARCISPPCRHIGSRTPESRTMSGVESAWRSDGHSPPAAVAARN